MVLNGSVSWKKEEEKKGFICYKLVTNDAIDDTELRCTFVYKNGYDIARNYWNNGRFIDAFASRYIGETQTNWVEKPVKTDRCKGPMVRRWSGHMTNV